MLNPNLKFVHHVRFLTEVKGVKNDDFDQLYAFILEAPIFFNISDVIA